jgi:hypothetical protein
MADLTENGNEILWTENAADLRFELEASPLLGGKYHVQLSGMLSNPNDEDKLDFIIYWNKISVWRALVYPNQSIAVTVAFVALAPKPEITEFRVEAHSYAEKEVDDDDSGDNCS